MKLLWSLLFVCSTTIGFIAGWKAGLAIGGLCALLIFLDIKLTID